MARQDTTDLLSFATVASEGSFMRAAKRLGVLGATVLLFATAALAQPAPPPPKGAHFIFERGGARIDVKCADDEPMRACADNTLQMLDKLSIMKQSDGH